MADPIWKKKLMEALGFTPRYDIDIGQRGKTDRRILADWAKRGTKGGGGASGLHPGVESGYQGGLRESSEVSPQFKGHWWQQDAAKRMGQWNPPSIASTAQNKNPTQVGWNKPKGGKKLKYIVEALQEMEGAEPPELSGGKFGRAMPAPLGFSLANMGAYVGDPVARQAAMAKARMEEELQRRRKLLGGGY